MSPKERSSGDTRAPLLLPAPLLLMALSIKNRKGHWVWRGDYNLEKSSSVKGIHGESGPKGRTVYRRLLLATTCLFQRHHLNDDDSKNLSQTPEVWMGG